MPGREYKMNYIGFDCETDSYFYFLCVFSLEFNPGIVDVTMWSVCRFVSKKHRL